MTVPGPWQRPPTFQEDPVGGCPSRSSTHSQALGCTDGLRSPSWSGASRRTPGSCGGQERTPVPRSHRASPRGPCDGSGRGGGPAALASGLPEEQGGSREGGRRPVGLVLSRSVRPGLPTRLADACFSSEAHRAGGARSRAGGSFLRWLAGSGSARLSPRGPSVAAHATGVCHAAQGERG